MIAFLGILIFRIFLPLALQGDHRMGLAVKAESAAILLAIFRSMGIGFIIP